MTEITYEQAAKALEIMENAVNEGQPKATIFGSDECQHSLNRKQRRIQASKERRKWRK